MMCDMPSVASRKINRKHLRKQIAANEALSGFFQFKSKITFAAIFLFHSFTPDKTDMRIILNVSYGNTIN